MPGRRLSMRLTQPHSMPAKRRDTWIIQRSLRAPRDLNKRGARPPPDAPRAPGGSSSSGSRPAPFIEQKSVPHHHQPVVAGLAAPGLAGPALHLADLGAALVAGE